MTGVFSPSRLQVGGVIGTQVISLLGKTTIMEATKLYVQLWVITPHYSLCDKSLFMIMTQEEVIDTDASGAEYVTFMHIQCRQKTNCICFIVSENYM